MWRLAVAAAYVAIELSSPARADARTDTVMQLSQGAIGSRIPDLPFQDASGKKISLVDFRGKPLLVTLIYTSCADLCPTLIENLGSVVETAEDVLGAGTFNVITVGFDTRNDTPQRMRSFARAHNASRNNWFFVGSDEATIERLAKAVGFSFSASAGGFDHLAQVTILDKTGMIYEQVYGSNFERPAIVEPLKRLILGGERSVFSLTGLGDRVKLFCTIYDPTTGRYYFNYALIVSIVIGAGCLLAIFVFLIRETRKSLRAGGA